MRDLDIIQSSILEEERTKPVFLIDITISSEEHLSTNGDITLNGVTYTTSDIGLSGASDWTSATIKLKATPERVQEVIAGGWQNNTCKIYLLPKTNFKQIYQYDYVQEDYGIQGELTGDPILLLDGVLDSGDINSSNVLLRVTHKAFVGQWTPRLRITNQFANHLPEVGSQITWEGEVYTLESR